MSPTNEVVGWAEKWHANYEATGGFHNGSAIVNVEAALGALLRQCAANQSKRFLGINRYAREDTPEPF